MLQALHLCFTESVQTLTIQFCHMKTVNNDLYFVAKHFLCRIDKTVIPICTYGVDRLASSRGNTRKKSLHCVLLPVFESRKHTCLIPNTHRDESDTIFMPFLQSNVISPDHR